MKKLVDDRGFRYKLYQHEDGQFELCIPIPKPAPGYDVLHFPDEAEMQEYETHGPDAFDKRIADMKVNYRNYKMNSWR